MPSPPVWTGRSIVPRAWCSRGRLRIAASMATDHGAVVATTMARTTSAVAATAMTTATSAAAATITGVSAHELDIRGACAGAFSLCDLHRLLCGQWACSASSQARLLDCNFAGAAAVVLLTWVFSLFRWCSFAPIGWLGSFIAGLKMSFGRSVGPWRKHDGVFNVNKAHRAADAGDAEERRRARRNGGRPTSSSVTDDSKGCWQAR